LDVFARKLDPNNKIEFLSDGNLDFASALSLRAKNQKLFVGWRSERYLLIIENGLIAKLRVEPNILTYSCTRAIDALETEYV
jgi:peroxiredoxin